VWRPWTEPYATWQGPHHRSPPSSHRRTHRREVLVLRVRPQHCGPCSCADPHRVVVPGTSRCPCGVANTRRDNSIRPKYQQKKNFKDLTWEHSKVEDIPYRKGCTSQVPWGTPDCGSAHRRCSSHEPPSLPWRPCVARSE
jgi:hypothetical protein